MTKHSIALSDLANSGIGGRETFERAIGSARAALREAAGIYRAAREEIALRRGLTGLDRRRLRDLGIDRNGA